VEALAKLKPVFAQRVRDGAAIVADVDGAAAVLLCSEAAAEGATHLTPIGKFLGFSVGGRAAGDHGHRAKEAIPRVLQQVV